MFLFIKWVKYLIMMKPWQIQLKDKHPPKRGNGGTKKLDQMSNQKTLVKSTNTHQWELRKRVEGLSRRGQNSDLGLNSIDFHNN